RERAEKAQQNEKDARHQAEGSARESHDRLIRFYETEGVRLMDQDDFLGALPWFAAALREDQGSPARERIHRTRLAVVTWLCPRLLQTLFPENSVDHAAFSPDDRLVATAALQSVRLWDAVTGAAVGPAITHPGPVHEVAFSPDGRRLVTAC